MRLPPTNPMMENDVRAVVYLKNHLPGSKQALKNVFFEDWGLDWGKKESQKVAK